MKFRKTHSKERKTYTYEYNDKERNTLEKVILRPGENGVTKENIKKLHALDDSEVYYNIKNSRPPLTDEEKAAIKEWEANHPGEVAPKNYNRSLDYLMSNESNSQDKSKILLQAYYSSIDEDKSPVSLDVKRLREVVKSLNPKQKQLYGLLVREYTLAEIAAELKTSVPNISKRRQRLFALIEEEFLKRGW